MMSFPVEDAAAARSTMSPTRTMDPTEVTTGSRNLKRKTPPTNEPGPAPQHLALMHSQHVPPIMPHYTYSLQPQGEYTPSGIQPQQQPQQPQQQQEQPRESNSPPPNSIAGRALSSSKRAEQNRKAQRAFRERRDQHVKALESRSQLLEAALASADEANRRWEECRALVDQLRVENAGMRAHIQMLQSHAVGASNVVPHLLHQQPQQQPSSDKAEEESTERKEDKPAQNEGSSPEDVQPVS